MDPQVMTREQVVCQALQVVLHAKNVDPEFFDACLAKVLKPQHSSPGFGRRFEQSDIEFAGLLSHAKGCKSALEIGSRFGESIVRIARVLAPGSRVVAVDLPYADQRGGEDPAPILKENIDRIGGMGHEAVLVIGDSHDPRVIEEVVKRGPYDFLFIDGDHSYEGVKADWENYGPHAKIVAFHDIVNNVDCVRFWKELRTKYRHVEYTSSCWLGIGVIFKD